MARYARLALRYCDILRMNGLVSRLLLPPPLKDGIVRLSNKARLHEIAFALWHAHPEDNRDPGQPRTTPVSYHRGYIFFPERCRERSSLAIQKLGRLENVVVHSRLTPYCICRSRSLLSPW